MRIRELLEDDGYMERMAVSIDDMLLFLLGNGVGVIPTAKLVKHLDDSGFVVTIDSLKPVLEKNPYVQNVTDRMVVLKTKDSESTDSIEKGKTTQEQNKEKVSKMAQNAAKKDLS